MEQSNGANTYVCADIPTVTAEGLRVGMVIIDGYGRTLLVTSKIGVQHIERDWGCNLPIHYYNVIVLGRASKIGNHGDKEETIQGNANAEFRLLNPTNS